MTEETTTKTENFTVSEICSICDSVFTDRKYLLSVKILRDDNKQGVYVNVCHMCARAIGNEMAKVSMNQLGSAFGDFGKQMGQILKDMGKQKSNG